MNERSPQHLRIDDYDYALPESRIARYPLAERDHSKLLVYRDGAIGTTAFRQLADELPVGSLLVFNDTRVIHARLHFTLPSGKPLEIFCLDPVQPAEYQLNFSSPGPVRWKCLVGGNRRWKSGEISTVVNSETGSVRLTARRLERLDDAFLIEFVWPMSVSFGALLAAAGLIPLPPYLNRASQASDTDRYQTVYAREQGSVAAPTAGLHFTEGVFASLAQRHIEREFVTLHVGAGTFKPVTSDTLAEHHMHEEHCWVTRSTLARLQQQCALGQPLISVGTTSLRTLETLYWLGVRCATGRMDPNREWLLPQWEAYEHPSNLPTTEALTALLDWMDQHGRTELSGQSQLLMAPGYRLRLIDALITNFHQPRSTLLLLVAALIGNDWRRVYDYALAHDYRFLSYGDSSLLWYQRK